MTAPVRSALVLLLAGAALSWGPRADAEPAHPAAVPAAAESDRAIFTGRFVSRPELQTNGTTRVRIYRVEVTEVFGPLDIATERIRIRSRFVLESCSAPDPQPNRGNQPQQPATTPSQTQTPSQSPTETPSQPAGDPVDRQLRLFDATVQGTEYVITSCGDLAIATDALVEQTEAQFGSGRPPGLDTEPAPDEFAEVGFQCPDTGEALPDLSNHDACESLADGQSFDRAAAPGLALVIVGVLGLIVARRMGRSRR